MNDARQAILDWQQKTISGGQLMRRLISYDKWNLPVSESGAAEIMATNELSRFRFHETEDGQRHLLIYTDLDAYKEGLAADEKPTDSHFLTTHGTTVFKLTHEGFSALLINPNTPTFIYYKDEQLVTLRNLAAAVEVDELLLKLRHGTGPEGGVKTAGGYDKFCLAVRKIDDQFALCYAPDSKGRELIAVFTADDAFDAYVAELPENIQPQVMQMNLTGAELFTHLARQTADGMVFNCCGPSKPVAFAMGLSAIMLAELNKQQ